MIGMWKVLGVVSSAAAFGYHTGGGSEGTCPVREELNAVRILERYGVIDGVPPNMCGNSTFAKNVILVIGDGMGWEMIRAGAIAKQVLVELESMGVDAVNGAATEEIATAAREAFAGRTYHDYYTEGVGSGLSFQNLSEFGLVTTSAMVIQEANEGAWYSPSGQSMLEGATQPSFNGPGVFTAGHDNGQSTLYLDDDGNPLEFDPRDYESEGGMMILWDDVKGGKYPWDENYYLPEEERDPDFDIRFKARHATDSASTAGSYATGVKTFTGAFGVDIYEQPVRTIVEKAKMCGKSAGTITSVPMLHATPAAFIAHSNHRNNGPQLQRTMMEVVNPTLAAGGCSSRNYPGGNYGTEHNIDYQSKIANGDYGKWTVIRNEANKTAAEVLAEFDAVGDPDDGHKIMACIPDGESNMPYRGVDSNYSHSYQLNSFGDVGIYDELGNAIGIEEGVEAGLGHAYTSEELAGIPKMSDLVRKAIEFLGKDDDGFFLMYEQGDIDWAAHSNHMDDMLGTMLDIDDSVSEIMDWIEANGGFEKNALYVTADHDHYLTLKENFPEVLAGFIIDGESYKITPATTLSGGYESEALLPEHQKANETIEDPNGVAGVDQLQGWANGTIDDVGHFWGVQEDGGNAWGSHSCKPVPISYEGDSGNCLKQLEGASYYVAGKEVQGSPEKIDQVHVHACMLKTLFGY